MPYFLLFAGGALFSYAFYAREISIGRRVQHAWLRGSTFFNKEIAAIEAELSRLFHIE